MFSQRLCTRVVASTLGLALLAANVSASVQYCSTLNTADTNRNSSIYQSNGLCHDFCLSSYAFAVVQSDGCWCSNYVPGTTTTGCTQGCPGYPAELCGGDGLYGYIALSKPPSGTKGASSPSAAPSTGSTPVSPSSTPIQMTVTAPGSTSPGVTLVSTVTLAPSSNSDLPNTPSTSPTPTTASTTSKTTPSPTPQSSSTWTPTPVVSLETVTGQVRTVTVTPTVPPNSQNLNGVAKDSAGGGKSRLGTGAAVGLTIGLVAIVAIIAAIAWFCFRKRKQEKADEFASLSRSNSDQGALGGSPGGTLPSRTMSENSRYVLNTNGRQVVETWEPENAGKRQSQLQPVDQRLDPFAPLYQRENRSRESVATLQDHVDYSRRVQQSQRVLRVNNPDSD